MNVRTACRVAALQMVSTADRDDNLAAASELIAEAAGAGASLVVLPENFACMPNREVDRLAIAERFGAGPIQDFLADKARSHAIHLVGGTLPVTGDQEDRPMQTCLVHDSEGVCVARYDKIHLFDVTVDAAESRDSYRESDYTTPGSEVVLTNTPAGRLGIAVCYDLRFPEIFRDLLDGGMECVAVPAAFTAATGRAHWEVLLRSRAIENLSWVIAAGQGGRHPNGRETFGHTMIVDPWGEIVNRIEQGPGVVLADVDPLRQKTIRNDFPALSHRRPE